jgi:hypothetical protein
LAICWLYTSNLLVTAVPTWNTDVLQTFEAAGSRM